MQRLALYACLVTACLWTLVGAAAPAQAGDDSYPTRTVTILCPFPAGGGTDIMTRLLAADLRDKLHGTVIVENRPGASTQIAASALLKAPADGYTLLVAPVTTLAIGPSVFKKLPYDTVKDFAPIALIGSAQFALVANPSVKAKTLAELIALIRASNGKMSYASSGRATPHHLFMEMFLKMIGGKALHVPYRGSNPALLAVVSGEVPMMMVDLAPALPLIKAGKLRVFGVTSAKRVAALPDVPTIAEAGLPGYDAAGWFSMVARAGTPQPIIDRLNHILVAYLKRPDVRERLNAMAIEPLTSTPAELTAFVPAEIKKWAKVVKDAGIEPQ